MNARETKTFYLQTPFWVVSQVRPVLHLFPAQQGCVTAPQALHVPSFMSQASVAALQVLPAQQTCPAAPHAAHVLLTMLQASVGSLQVLPAQQTCPAAPHAAAAHIGPVLVMHTTV